ncbi:uncharacterized protein MONBRDRAFT_12490 [Monosiga brevicollis MX1]|uniref:glutathione gamma-glutamylcysteinyltransferase n=1 Tax=Monosiga brevicollis TaxID=81824 RepID=A9VCF7_MONBE|nr:uncharacterized protein MONBRDRAFT_12490 [Monosiga brevicollis MX1]EDQ84778.1 predicted protein [Monosiga brevicollis MX1]|eukprot:XP_001750428.1 hypothetical protein [Monosiga brevicollis MX1]
MAGAAVVWLAVAALVAPIVGLPQLPHGERARREMPLPPELIASNSSAGVQLLLSAQAQGYAEPFWQLSMTYTTQQNQAYCSVASSAMSLNALGVPAPVDAVYSPYNYFTQSDVFTPCAVNQNITEAYVATHGLTLAQAHALLACFPAVDAQLHHAGQAGADLAAFSRDLNATSQGTHALIIINFLRTGMHQEGGGHFSPLAAYDPVSDRILVLDVARYKYPSFWATRQDVFNAMNTIDSSSQQTRGWIVLRQANN